MRKTIALLAFAIMSAVLAGCGGGGGTGSSKPANIGSTTIVGEWTNQNNDVIIFLDNGIYFYGTANAESTGACEYGTYTWDQVTGAFTASPSYDESNTIGFSGMSGAITMMKSNATLSITNGGSTTTFSKMLISSSDPLIGTWISSNGDSFYTITYAPDGRLYVAMHAHGNMWYEYGTFSTGNAGTFNFTTTASSQQGQIDSGQESYTLNQSGTLTVDEVELTRLSTD